MLFRSFFVLPLLAALGLAQQPPKLRLQEVQDIHPVSYKVDLQLDPAKTDFEGSIEIALELGHATNTIWLNASKIDVIKATLSEPDQTLTATPIPTPNDFVGLHFPSPIAPGTAILRVQYKGAVRTPQPEGIFSSQDRGNKYLTTQFEATDARDAFPCFDEPSYKVPWQLTLHIPASSVAVSNTPIESEQTTGTVKTVVFRQTKPLPSYLVAFAVGPFEFVQAGTAGRNHFPVRIVVPKGRANEAKFAAENTARMLDMLEDYFGIPYPYEKSDQVTLLKADFGAMENAGMVTYDPAILLAKPENDSVVRQREYVLVAFHELAHQWFGDFVTMQWWDDVWLNEAFASWMEKKMRAVWNPEWNHAEDVVELQGAERTDMLRSSRKIHQEIQSDGDIYTAFDGITYLKGAAVIGMFENWIGPDAFRAGVHNYLQRFAFKNATTTDLLDALNEASHRDVKSAFSTFVNQPGMPLVSVKQKCGRGSLSLELEQQRLLSVDSSAADDSIWQIPICVHYGSRGDHGKACQLMTARRQEWKLPGASCPAWVDANADAKGYYRVQYSPDMLAALMADDVRAKLNPSERSELLGNASIAVSVARLPYAKGLQLVKSFASDSDPSTTELALDLVLSVKGFGVGHRTGASLLPADLEPNYRSFLASTFGPRAHALGWIPKTGESLGDRLTRTNLLTSYTIFSDDRTLVDQAKLLANEWLSGKRSLDSAQVKGVLEVYAAFASSAEAERLRVAAKQAADPQDAEKIVSALTYVRTPEAALANMTAFVAKELPDNIGQMLVLSLPTDETRKLPFEFVQKHFDAVMNVMPYFYRPSLPQVGASFCDESSKEQLKAFFEPRAAQVPGTDRVLAQTVETIDACMMRKAAQQGDVRSFFQTQRERVRVTSQ